MRRQNIGPRPVELLFASALSLAAILSAPSGLAAQTAPAPAGGEVLYACYVPVIGTVYRIKVAGGKDACWSAQHVMFSWNEKGIQGAQGPAGPQGPKGDPGDKGADGAAGPQGPAGPAGPKGEQGSKGDTGPAGPKGDTGATGAQGTPGTNGVSGLQAMVRQITFPPAGHMGWDLMCPAGKRATGGGGFIAGGTAGNVVVGSTPIGNLEGWHLSVMLASSPPYVDVYAVCATAN